MKNVMDEYIEYSIKCFLKYFKLIYGNKYNKTFTMEYLNTYIDIRYSNYLNESTISMSIQKKISKGLNNLTTELIKNNPNMKDYLNSLNIFTNYLYDLDQLYILEAQKRTISLIANDREKLLGLNDSGFSTELNNMLLSDMKMRKDYLDSFLSNTFETKYKEINKNNYYATLENNITFPELYSEAAINKVKESDVVSEDLTIITALQVTSNIINDLISCNFNSSYVIYMPPSFYMKKTKINRLFNIIDNQFIQDKLRLLISYETFKRYKTYVREYMRDGFVFSIYLDKTFDYSTSNLEYLELFNEIYLDSKKYYYKDMKNNGRIKNRIVNIDEVI